MQLMRYSGALSQSRGLFSITNQFRQPQRCFGMLLKSASPTPFLSVAPSVHRRTRSIVPSSRQTLQVLLSTQF
jgi:hypothetical protein